MHVRTYTCTKCYRLCGSHTHAQERILMTMLQVLMKPLSNDLTVEAPLDGPTNKMSYTFSILVTMHMQ